MTNMQHHHVGTSLQRSLITWNGILYRRIACWVTPEGELDTAPDVAVWQERIHTGDFHNIVGEFAIALEKRFIAALIEVNRNKI